MIFYFDTSVINQFPRIRDGGVLLEKLLTHHEVYISTLNIIEIGKTPDSQQREQLRSVAKKLAKDYNPLELTNHLVRQLCVGFQQGRSTMSWTIDEEERGEFWVALSQPNALGEDERAELATWASTLEADQLRSNQQFRAILDEVFAANPGPRPDTPGKLVRIYVRNWRLVYEITAKIYKGATDRVLPLSRLDAFLQAKPRIWALYLAAQVYSVFYGCVWIEGQKWAERHHKQNPVGLLDLWAAVYLAACDIFVTNDTKHGGQYNAIRWLNQFNVRKPRTRVMTWSNFRRRLASDGFGAA